MRVKIADCVFDICPVYDYLTEFLKDYIVGGNEPLNGCIPEIAVSEADIDFENQDYEHPFDRGYLETLAVLRKVSEYMSAMDIVLFHGVAMTFCNQCYLISAPSGTGKSTHAALWKKYLGGDRVTIINGDKPFIRCTENDFLVYGTPWCGKEGIQVNTCAKLAGIIFLDRGKECSIRIADERDAVNRLFRQLHMTHMGAVHILKVCDAIIKYVPCYNLVCDISPDAVRTSFEAVTGMDFDKFVLEDSIV